MTYYSDLRAGKVEAGTHLTGTMEFYTVMTLVPLATEVLNSKEPSAGDNFRVLCDVLSCKGEPVVQGFKAEKVAVAGLGFGSDFDGQMDVYTYKFSLEQPRVWGEDADAVKAAIAEKLSGVKVPFVAEGGEEEFIMGDEEKANTVVLYAQEL